MEAEGGKIDDQSDVLVLTLHGLKLKNVEGTLSITGLDSAEPVQNRLLRAVDNFWGKSDPFFEVCAATETCYENRDKKEQRKKCQRVVVARSDVVMDKLSPKWDPVAVDLHELCRGDVDASFYIDIYDWEENGKHRPLGSFDATVRKLLESTQPKLGEGGLRRLRGKDIEDRVFVVKHNGKDCGNVVVDQATLERTSLMSTVKNDIVVTAERNVMAKPESEAIKLQAEREVGLTAVREAEECSRIAAGKETSRLKAEQQAVVVEVEGEVEPSGKTQERFRSPAEQEATELNAQEEARLVQGNSKTQGNAEEETVIATEQETRLNAEEEEQIVQVVDEAHGKDRTAAEQEAARLRAAQEERLVQVAFDAQCKAEEEERLALVVAEAKRKAEEKEIRRAEEQEAATLKSKKEERAVQIVAEAKRKAEAEEARIASEQEAARSKAEEEERLALVVAEAKRKAEAKEIRRAEELEAARLKAGKEERVAQVVAEAKRKAEEKEAGIASEQESSRFKAGEEERLAQVVAEAKRNVEDEEEAGIAAKEQASRIVLEKEARLAEVTAEAKPKAKEAGRLKAKKDEKTAKCAKQALQRSSLPLMSLEKSPQDGRACTSRPESVFERLYRTDTTSYAAKRMIVDYFKHSNFQA